MEPARTIFGETHIMTRTANELAEFLACTLEGDGSVQLSGVAAAGSANVSDLIYVEKASHLARAAASQARCVVIAPELAINGKTLLRASNPKLAFAKAAAWLVPPAPIANTRDSRLRALCRRSVTASRAARVAAQSISIPVLLASKVPGAFPELAPVAPALVRSTLDDRLSRRAFSASSVLVGVRIHEFAR